MHQRRQQKDTDTVRFLVGASFASPAPLAAARATMTDIIAGIACRFCAIVAWMAAEEGLREDLQNLGVFFTGNYSKITNPGY